MASRRRAETTLGNILGHYIFICCFVTCGRAGFDLTWPKNCTNAPFSLFLFSQPPAPRHWGHRSLDFWDLSRAAPLTPSGGYIIPISPRSLGREPKETPGSLRLSFPLSQYWLCLPRMRLMRLAARSPQRGDAGPRRLAPNQ